MQTIRVGPLTIGPTSPLAIIAGPCAAESLDLCLRVGEALRDRCAELGFGYIFKASFDKANRTSIKSVRGPGLDAGLRLLERVKKKLGVPVTTDIHESQQAAPAAEVIDLLQIPAFLCRQTDLLVAAAKTGRAVNVKKGQFLSAAEMANVIAKLAEAFETKSEERRAKNAKPKRRSKGEERMATGAARSSRSSLLAPRSTLHAPRSTPPGILLTERGTFFGYHRLVNDFVGLGDMMEMGWPVCFDVTHSTQKPGEGATSGGRPERAPLLARCAVAAGVQALFLETHPDPARALSDGATMLPLKVTLPLLGELARLREVVRGMT